MITIIGAGFGALSSVREIRKRDRNIAITLIAPRAELHYLPGIIWIPSGLRTRAQLVVPLENFFRRMHERHMAAKQHRWQPQLHGLSPLAVDF